jgi:hypothetical protein
LPGGGGKLQARNLPVMGDPTNEILVAIGHFEMRVASPRVTRLKRGGSLLGGSPPEIFGIAFHEVTPPGPRFVRGLSHWYIANLDCTS